MQNVETEGQWMQGDAVGWSVNEIGGPRVGKTGRVMRGQG